MKWRKMSWQSLTGPRGNQKATQSWGHDAEGVSQHNWPFGNSADPWEDPWGQKTLLKDFNVELTDEEKDPDKGIVDQLFFNPGEQTREKKVPGGSWGGPRYHDIITPGSTSFRDAAKHSWKKISDANGTPYYDVVRHNSPSMESAPAAAETAVPAPNSVWHHMGDNGIEVYPSPMEDPKLIKDILMHYQNTRFTIPQGTMNVNKIGQIAEQSEETQNLQQSQEERNQQKPVELPPIALHVIKTHLLDEKVVMQLLENGELDEVHLLQHVNGIVDNHNPEVLRVASAWADHLPKKNLLEALCLEHNDMDTGVTRNPDTSDEEIKSIHADQLNSNDYECVCKTGTNTWVPRKGNILDPISQQLDPEVFDSPTSTNPRLKNTIRNWVTAKVYHLMITHGLPNPEKWIKLVLTGSLTTYQWTDDSDFDVSVWIDVDQLDEFDRSMFVKLVVENLDGQIVPGTSHPIQCFVVDMNQVHEMRELYSADVRSAWNIDKGNWLVKPNKLRVHNVQQEYPEVYHRGLNSLAKMKTLIKYQPTAAAQYWNYIHERRRTDMKAGRGDFADSNVAYKMIANAGLFSDIEDITGEHIASVNDYEYWPESYNDEDHHTTYHHLRAFPKGVTYEPKQCTSLEEYEIHKLTPHPKEVGFLSWWDNGNIAQTEELHVHPDHRRNSMGTGLVETAKGITNGLTSSPYRTAEGEAFLKGTKSLPNPTSPIEQSILRGPADASIEPRYSFTKEAQGNEVPQPKVTTSDETCPSCGGSMTINQKQCNTCTAFENNEVSSDRESHEQLNVDLIGDDVTWV